MFKKQIRNCIKCLKVIKYKYNKSLRYQLCDDCVQELDMIVVAWLNNKIEVIE